jgi:hypothetical protein
VLRLILDKLTSLEVGQKSLEVGQSYLKREIQERLRANSPAQLGLEQREFVRANNLIRIFVPTKAAAVLTDDEKNMLEEMDESSLQEFIFGKLQKLVKGRVVARSENYGWIETASKNSLLKSDALIINRAFLKVEGGAGQVLRGIPAHKSLFWGTDLVDFKKDNTSFALGELINHLQHLEANAVPFTGKIPFAQICSERCPGPSRWNRTVNRIAGQCHSLGISFVDSGWQCRKIIGVF